MAKTPVSFGHSECNRVKDFLLFVSSSENESSPRNVKLSYVAPCLGVTNSFNMGCVTGHWSGAHTLAAISSSEGGWGTCIGIC